METKSDPESFNWELASLDNYLSLYADKQSFMNKPEFTRDTNGDLISYWTSDLGGMYGGQFPLPYYVNAQSFDKTAPGYEAYMSGIFKFDGNFVHTPIPGALWLLGSGILALVGISRKRNLK